jgi:hypothetical protein
MIGSSVLGDGGEHRERGPHMVIKSVVRDASGSIVSVLERALTPTQRAAVHLYDQLERISRHHARPNAAPVLVIRPDAIHQDVDHEELLALVRARGRRPPAVGSVEVAELQPSDRRSPV